jgi:hypothetical protein
VVSFAQIVKFHNCNEGFMPQENSNEVIAVTNILEITGDDVALLSDTDLRSLVGLLCEADFRSAGLSTKGITWGGHQDASDGGLDVTVRSEFPPPQNSFVPRKVTGFQVKKPNMPRAKILAEMRPKGELREEIKELIYEGGAYVIVSSNGSTTEKSLKDRIAAMNEAIADESDHQTLYVDFLDRGRIASWVRSHPSLILWVRNRIGRPLRGWQSYDNWANTPTGIQEEYLIDDELRLYDGIRSDRGESVLDGLQKLRLLLSSVNASIRLTGLSGVGKTRLVQALFDASVGHDALNLDLAYYTNISDNPIPDPVSFASQLIAADTKAVLIVDNCSQELHRQLTKACAKSPVNLLTIEYDIRDDLPEETKVFRLEPASDELIKKLLQKHYKHISPPNAHTIAEFASGNARVAIALANTLKQGESLSTLRDEELFARLFHQRHNPNEDLRVSAEICSLVYSFNGENAASGSELEFLANLANKSVRQLYRDIQELRNRGLVQSRGVWRAVLPHAIANRLAKYSLDVIPKDELTHAFLHGSERLIQSFTRRLGYLHDCIPAVEIASDWLKPDGWLGDTNCNFSTLGLNIFKNIAPIVPEAALAMLERATSNTDERVFNPEADVHRREFIRLLRHLAYEPDLFPRSVKLLIRCALLERPDINDGDAARAILKKLFHIILSGTHVPLQIRADIVNEIATSDRQNEAELGIILLESALKTYHFDAFYVSSFGARPRDFGYWPISNQEVIAWYKRFIEICTHIAISDNSTAPQARRVFANSLRGLWMTLSEINQDSLKMLEDSIATIHEKRAWNEGWVSAKGILRYEGKSMQQDLFLRLKRIEECLRPKNLIERARTYALITGRLIFDLEDDYDEDDTPSSQWTRIQRITREIGSEAVQDDAIFQELLPELVSAAYDYNRLKIFGEGLADGCQDRQNIWQMLYTQLEITPPDKQQFAVLIGFMSSSANHDPVFYNAVLDILIEDELLGPWFPNFQTTSIIDARGIERLHQALDSDKSHINSFRSLAWSLRGEIDDDNLATLLQKILTKEGGVFVAIEILTTRVHRTNNEPVDFSPDLVTVAREVILKYPYNEKHDRTHHLDYELAQVAQICLYGPDGVEYAKRICQILANGLQQYKFYTFDYPYLFKFLAQSHPHLFLDTFIGLEESHFYRRGFDALDREDNPANQIPQSVLIDWCEWDPEVRYTQLVASLSTYSKSKEADELHWMPLVFSILEKAPNVQAVLSRLESTIYPMSWSGSYADTLERRLVLFTSLYDHPNSVVREWADGQHTQLKRRIEKERENDLRENQARFERFE